MKRALARVVFLFPLWVFPHAAFSKVIPDTIREAQFLAGLELVAAERFGPADSLFRALVKADPGDPWGHFFWAVEIAARMMDAEQDSFSPAFSIQLSIAQQLAEKELKKLKKGKKQGARPDLFLLMGNIWGYRAIYEHRRGYWGGGLSAGLKAKKNFDRALGLDSTLYDAYSGLGNYNFWKSARTRKFLISAFFPDERKKGMEQLIWAREKGYFSRPAAAASLMWASINQKDYVWAQKLADSLAAAYPEAKSPLWALGTIYQEKKMWDSTAAVFSELFRRLEADSSQSGFNFVECRWRLANAYFNSGRYQNALLECEAAKSYRLPPKSRKKLKTRLESLAEISKKSRRALAQKDPE
ncbi:MAG: tetratricopeptide repeat protein [Limisphaerales bacterium]